MTVSVQTPVVSYVANGATTSFPFPFQVLRDSDLKIYLNGVEQPHYEEEVIITGIGDAEGGDVEFVEPPASGVVVRLQRVVELSRETDYMLAGRLHADTLDEDFDIKVMMIQDLDETTLHETSDGKWDARGKALKNVGAPTAGSDAVNKTYADSTIPANVDAAAASAAAASGSASAAATSATNAAGSASAAATSATNAAGSATAAAASESTAASSASNAATSETNAGTSATNALASENKAADWAEKEEDSEVEPGKYSALHHAAKSEASATNAATSATNAGTSETNAAGSATAAATSATNAATSATNAATAATNAANSFDEFDDRYLGAKASAPTLDNDGDALITGALYYNTTVLAMQVYNGTGWDNVGSATTIIYEFVATAGQTTFSGTDVNGKGLTYNAGFELVMVNGVRYGSDLYTATSGSSVVFDTGLTAGDKVTVVAFGTFSVADTYTQAQADATFAPITRSRKNYIINGNFDIWQRGTSFSATTTSQYLADRWHVAHSQQVAASRQAFTLGQTEVPNNPKYFHRSVVSAGTNSDFSFLQQKIESVRTLAGKSVTLSFYAKADSAKNVAIGIIQEFGSGGSPSTRVYGDHQLISLTTNWTRFTVTFEVPSISGKTLGTNGNDALWVEMVHSCGSSRSDFTERGEVGNQSGTFDIAQVQLEEGSVATDFEYRHIGEETALCQRYFVLFESDAFRARYRTAANAISVVTFGPTPFPVTMRTIPTMSYTTTTSTNASNFDVEAENNTSYRVRWDEPSPNSSVNIILSDIKADAEL